MEVGNDEETCLFVCACVCIQKCVCMYEGVCVLVCAYNVVCSYFFVQELEREKEREIREGKRERRVVVVRMGGCIYRIVFLLVQKTLCVGRKNNHKKIQEDSGCKRWLCSLLRQAPHANRRQSCFKQDEWNVLQTSIWNHPYGYNNKQFLRAWKGIENVALRICPSIQTRARIL